MKKFKPRSLQFNRVKITVSLESEYWEMLDRYFAKGVKRRLSGREGHALLKDLPEGEEIANWLRAKAKAKHEDALRLDAEQRAIEGAKTPEQRQLAQLEKIAHLFADSSFLKLTERQIQLALQEMFGEEQAKKSKFLELCEASYRAQKEREESEMNDLTKKLQEEIDDPKYLPDFVADQLDEIKGLLAV